MLRANVQVSGDLVRIGDVIDNAGSAAQIAIYRAPDLGTTGSLPVAQVLNTLRAHQVIGVDTRDLKEISVTRLARTLESKDIELQVARALERRNGLGDAANLQLTFDRDPGDVRLDASFTGGMQAAIVRYDNRNGRFDVTFEIANENGAAPTKLRFTGTAVETVEAAVLARNVERNEVIKSSDVVVERRPEGRSRRGCRRARPRRSACRPAASSAPARRSRTADLAKPDLVQRDQNVTLIYEAAGLYLTMRGKALENGTEGDVVNVHEPAVEAHGVRHRDRPRPGCDHRRPVPPGADQRCRLFARSPAPPRPSPSPPSIRQSLQKPSNVNVSLPYQPHHPVRRLALAGRRSRAVAPRSTVSPRSAKSRS